MKLRWQLALWQLLLVLSVTLLIGGVNLALLIGGAQSLERQNLESALTATSHQLLQRITDLQSARDEIGSAVAAMGQLHNSVDEVAHLHALLALYRVERIEVFQGTERQVYAYRWERGAARHLETSWPPANPRIADQLAQGRATIWVQRGAVEKASLKLCTPLPATPGGESRSLVLTEPFDGVLLSRIIPAQLVGTVEDDKDVLIGWPESPQGATGDISQLRRYLPRAPFAALLDPLIVRRGVAQLDSGSTLSIALMASPMRSGQSLLQGLRAWFLVFVGGAILALLLGSHLAARLLAPLNALLEGTAAMARGHLMVRLPAGREDELGALMREFNRMADEIRNTYLGVISTLAEMVEAKSHYTREHVERVERLTMATAEVLEKHGWVRFSSHQRFLLSVAAILHDVGKIAIGNEVLNKSGPLSNQERQQILTHPEVGALIVERMGKLERAAEIIRCDHEHFDGSGYPRGLKGEEIPLESRIILAVDAFDAMTKDRPYSAGRPMENAIAELRSEAGRQFDPVVVEALIEVVTSRTVEMPTTASDSGLYRAIHPDSDPALRAVSGRPPELPE